jgi:hypothetical protein
LQNSQGRRQRFRDSPFVEAALTDGIGDGFDIVGEWTIFAERRRESANDIANAA